MDDSNKSKLFTFGKLENPEDSDSEESLSDSTDEDSVLKDEGKDNSSKTNKNQQELVKEMERLNFKDPSRKVPINSSDTSSKDSCDFYKRRNYDGPDTAAAQPRRRYGIYPERRNLFGLGQRLRGNWGLRCDDQETNLDGLTESDITWAAVNELHEKEAGIFTLRPYKCSSKEGYTSINIYTPDCRDEEFILKVANLFREHVYFPYVMYYHSRNSSSSYMHTPNGEFYRKERSLTPDGEMMLPSEVTDKEYIYMPSTSEEIDDEEDMNTSGKWMVFPNGDLQKLDQYWLALIPLYKNGTLSRLKCSTAMGLDPGVINCYTVDSENPADVKNAADAIRECIDYDKIMYYKTNEATALGLYLRFGSKNISKYMHTVKNCLYEKDKFERWKLVPL